MPYGTVNAEQMTTQSGYTLGAGNASSFKNRIINGNMVINQRASGTTVTLDTSQGYQFLDRYRFVGGFAGYTNTVQQSTTVPSGFSTSLLWTNTASAGAITSGSYNSFWQNIEGYNISDLAWGTADAKPITLSFWVRSSVIGTYGVTFTNGTNYYVASYTVNTANTWEQKTVSIAGATTGTWNTSSSTGLTVKWDMGVGSTYSASAGTWGTGNIWGLTGGIKFVETNGATFYITGVQIEVGTVATSFDFRSISTELGLCYRYCFAWRTDSLGYTQYGRLPAAFVTGTTSCTTSLFLPQPMRSTAYSLTWNNKAYQEYYLTGAGATGSTITLNTDANGINWVALNLSFTGTALPTTQGIVAGVRFTNVTDGALIISTEL